MLSEVSAAISALNGVRQIGAAILELRQDEATREKVQELREKITDAFDSVYQLSQDRLEQAEKIRQLEVKLSEFEKWEEQERRYRLTALAPNVMAMRPIEIAGETKPDHLLCANCFVDRKARFLHQTHRSDHYNAFKCNGCGQEIHWSNRRSMSWSDAEVSSSDWRVL